MDKRTIGLFGAILISSLLWPLQARSVQFETLETLASGVGFITALTLGPEDPNPNTIGDGCIYALDGLTGMVHRLCFDEDKVVTSNAVVIDLNGPLGVEHALGITIDPASDPDGEIHVYISYSSDNTAPFNGKVARATSTDGGVSYVVDENFIIGLARAGGDGNHQTNGLDFGPDGCLYIAQGANSNSGYDAVFAESRLSGAILRACFKDTTGGVALAFDRNCGSGNFQEACHVEVYASGFRNPFDLAWHSNDSLYSPDNDASLGFGLDCGTERNNFGCSCQEPVVQPIGDELNLVEEGRYYGSPNPYRAIPSGLQCQGGSNAGGACTTNVDCVGGGTCEDFSSLCTDSVCGEVAQCFYYGFGEDPEPGEDPNGIYQEPLLQIDALLDGITEYRSRFAHLSPGDFCSDWNGDLLITGGPGSLQRFTLSSDGRSAIHEGVNNLNGASGLDVVVGPDGTTYLADLNGGGVTYLKPVLQPDPIATDFFAACASGQKCNNDLQTCVLSNLIVHLDFDDGSGNTAKDSSGNGNDGTVEGAIWSSGQEDGALEFDGLNDQVVINPIPVGMDSWSAITVAAWVKNDVGAVGQTHDIASFWNFPSSRSWVLTHHKNNQYFWEISGQGNVSGGSVSTEWVHVVGTYNGSTMRLYINGIEVANQSVVGGTLPSSTAELIFGGQGNGSNYFDGLIDDIRIYHQGFTAQEVQNLFQAGTVHSDSTPPTIPQNLQATDVGMNEVTLDWNPSTDQESGIDHYNVYRDNMVVAQPTNTSVTDSPLLSNMLYTYEVSAVNGAGLESGRSTPALPVTTLADGTPPTVVTVVPNETTVVVTFDEPVGSTTATTLTNYTITPGITVLGAALNVDTVTLTTDPHSEGVAYTLTVANVEDTAGNAMTSADFPYTVTLTDPTLAVHLPFDETQGLTAPDSSGNGNDGTLVNGVTWDSGQGSGAVRFDGVNDLVSVDPAPMQMQTWTAITVAAWVNNDDGAVGQTHDIASWWNYPASRSWVLTHHRNNQYFWEIMGQGFVTGGTVSTNWTLVVGTYDGSTMRLYVDDLGEVASTAVPGGTLASSTAALIIGSQDDGSNFFDGLIDDVKIYDRALDAQEVLTLFQGGVPQPDTTAPSVPENLLATNIDFTEVTLSWDPSVDVESGIDHYNLYRNDVVVAQPTTTSVTDSPLLADTTYKYEVSAVNGADLESGLSNPSLFVTTLADTTAPTVTINQANGQLDPTTVSPVNFTVVFNEPVSGFTTGDVTLGGTAGATTATVSETAPNDGTTYNAAVSGMTGTGTIIATIAGGVSTDSSGNPNDASTSTDNTVMFETDTTAPTVLALYTFETGSGTTVFDVSGVAPAMNLTIEDEDRVTWLQGGGLSIDAPTIIETFAPADKIIQASMSTNEVSVEAWIVPVNVTQDGPARIVALTANPVDPSNFMVGQGLWGNQPSDLITARCPLNDHLLATNTPPGSLRSELTHVVFTRQFSTNTNRVYINGNLVASSERIGDFSDWDPTYHLNVANDQTRNRPWLGELHLIAIYDRELSAEEIERNFQKR